MLQLCPKCRRPLAIGSEECDHCGSQNQVGGKLPRPSERIRDMTRNTVCWECGMEHRLTEVTRLDGRVICMKCFKELGLDEQDDSHQENRHGHRIPLKKQFVHLHKTGLAAIFRFLKQSDDVIGSVVDVSSTGLQCITSMPLKVDEIVQIDLALPGMDGVLPVKAAVRWIEEGANRRVGLEYVDLDQEARSFLVNFSLSQMKSDGPAPDAE